MCQEEDGRGNFLSTVTKFRTVLTVYSFHLVSASMKRAKKDSRNYHPDEYVGVHHKTMICVFVSAKLIHSGLYKTLRYKLQSKILL